MSTLEQEAQLLQGTARQLKFCQLHVLQTYEKFHLITYIHTYIHPFNGPLSGTTRVSRYQKGKTNLDFIEGRDREWQWHLLGRMQVCTSLQTDNHPAPHQSVFLQTGCPSCRPTNSVKALQALIKLADIDSWHLFAKIYFTSLIRWCSAAVLARSYARPFYLNSDLLQTDRQTDTDRHATTAYTVPLERQNECATRIFAAASYEYWLMAVVVGFHCDVISCGLARRGVRRGVARSRPAAAAESGLGTRSIWPLSSIEDNYSSFQTTQPAILNLSDY